MSAPTRAGRYQILGLIGQGAMGAVYRGRDPQLERPVAIKLISAAAAGSGVPGGEAEARFLREARVAARLNHPNIVAVHDAGREGTDLYLVMELVDGESLSARLARGDYPATAEALEIVAQAADALAAAHAAGVIHRDVKPANLLLSPGGRVKVSDFGVAKAMGEGTDLTRTGMILGSPAYMAPEQVRSGTIDGRADLFSLGVVLYEMLLRRKPFPADTVTSLVYQILHEDPFTDPALSSQLGGELGELLRWCLAKDPGHRVPDAATLAARARAVAGRYRPLPEETAPTALLVAPARSGLAQPAPTVPAKPGDGALTPAGKGWGSRTLTLRGRRAWAAAALLAGIFVLVLAAVTLRAPRPPRSPASSIPPASGGAPGSVRAVSPEAEVEESPTQPVELSPPATVGPAEVAGAGAGEETPAASSSRAGVAPGAGFTSPRTSGARSSAPVVRSDGGGSGTSAVAEGDPAIAPTEPSVPISARFECREGAEFDVTPEETLVTVDGALLGPADDWDGKGGGRVWRPPGPGTYTVRLDLAGHHTRWIEIVVRSGARHKVVEVEFELQEID